jgi:hypothetical protein
MPDGHIGSGSGDVLLTDGAAGAPAAGAPAAGGSAGASAAGASAAGASAAGAPAAGALADVACSRSALSEARYSGVIRTVTTRPLEASDGWVQRSASGSELADAVGSAARPSESASGQTGSLERSVGSASPAVGSPGVVTSKRSPTATTC